MFAWERTQVASASRSVNLLAWCHAIKLVANRLRARTHRHSIPGALVLREVNKSFQITTNEWK